VLLSWQVRRWVHAPMLLGSSPIDGFAISVVGISEKGQIQRLAKRNGMQTPLTDRWFGETPNAGHT
jgi:hypothetical protein